MHFPYSFANKEALSRANLENLHQPQASSSSSTYVTLSSEGSGKYGFGRPLVAIAQYSTPQKQKQLQDLNWVYFSRKKSHNV